MSDYLTTKEMAESLGVNEETIRREIKRGHMPHIKVGRVYRIPRTAITPSPVRVRVSLEAISQGCMDAIERYAARETA